MTAYNKDFLIILLVLGLFPINGIVSIFCGKGVLSFLITLGIFLIIMLGMTIIYSFNDRFNYWCNKPFNEKTKQLQENMCQKTPIYIYKNNIYRIVKESRTKHPQTREWFDTIIYTRADKTNGEWFVREREEFFNRFQVVCPENNNNINPTK